MVLDFEAARLCVESKASTVAVLIPAESVPLLECSGRTLAEDIAADRDFPPFNRSTRDGYAVDASDTTKSRRIVAEIKAGGSNPALKVGSGETASIMTGAPLPEGTNAVVMIEHTERRGDTVHLNKLPENDENVVHRASEARAGHSVLKRGMLLDYASLAVAASVGKSLLLVAPRPRVAILATGDEVVELDCTPAPDQIRNSNSFSLAAQVRDAGGNPIILPVAPDRLDQLRASLQQAFHSDLVIIAGGVSAGKYDLVEQALAELGAEFFFTGVKIQPGKPAVFGCVRSPAPKYFFGLPGNPVSTMVTFDLFVEPVIAALSGRQPGELLFVHTRLGRDISVKTGLTRFLPAILSGRYAESLVELVPWRGSGDVVATARANCYIVVGPDRGHIAAGEFVPIMLRSAIPPGY